MKTPPVLCVGNPLGEHRAQEREDDDHPGPDGPHRPDARRSEEWRRWLALSMSLFAAVPLLDGHVATGGGLLALFAGLLVLALVVDAEVPGQIAPRR